MAIGLAVTVKLLTNKELAYIGPVLSTEVIIIIIIIITDLHSAFRSEDTEALDAAQED